jgi:hypothetical protein
MIAEAVRNGPAAAPKVDPYAMFRERAAGAEPLPPRRSPRYGAQNQLFTADRAEAALARLREKGGRLSSGVDPTILADLVEVGGYHVEAGLRQYGAWQKQMVADLGDEYKHVLPGVWKELRDAARRRAAALDKAAAAEAAKVAKAAPEARTLKAIEALGGADALTKEAAAIAAAGDDPFKLSEILARNAAYTAGDRFHAYHTANLLSSPRGVLRHVWTQQAFALIERTLTPAVRAAVDVPLAKLQGRPREFFAAELGPSIAGYLQGAAEGLQQAREVWAHGMTADQAAKLEVPHVEAPGPLKYSHRLRSAADAIAKGMAYRGELGALAVRQAIKEDLVGAARRSRVEALMADPTAELHTAARKMAEYSAFQGHRGGEPDFLLRAATNLANVAIPEGHVGEGLKPLRVFLPFLRVPYMIVRRGLEYTPAGGVGALLEKKVRSSPELADRLAKSIIGTGIMLPFLGYAHGGNVTGPGPDTPAEREAWAREGKVPFGVKIGDRWVEYKGWGPLAYPLLFAAAFAARDRADRPPKHSLVGQAVLTIGGAVGEEFFLRGVTQLQEAIDDPERAGMRFLDGLARGLVPLGGGLANVEQAVDPYRRDTRRQAPPKPAAGDPLARTWQELTEGGAGVARSVQSGIPGLASKLPPRLDSFGRPERHENAGGLAFVPAKVGEPSRDPVDRELSRLEIPPPGIQETARVEGQAVRLKPAEGRRLRQVVGGAEHEALAALLASPGYRAASSDEERRQLIQKALAQARGPARAAELERDGYPAPRRRGGSGGLGGGGLGLGSLRLR